MFVAISANTDFAILKFQPREMLMYQIAPTSSHSTTLNINGGRPSPTGPTSMFQSFFDVPLPAAIAHDRIPLANFVDIRVSSAGFTLLRLYTPVYTAEYGKIGAKTSLPDLRRGLVRVT